MKVVGKKILVKQAKTKEVSEGGIVMTADSIQTLPYGTVEQIGPDVEGIKPGEVILFEGLTAVPVAIREGCVLIEEEDILAILEEGDY